LTVKKARTAKVYVVTTPSGVRLVRAMTSQSAIKHCVHNSHQARLASQNDLINLLDAHLVEDAGTEGDDE